MTRIAGASVLLAGCGILLSLLALGCVADYTRTMLPVTRDLREGTPDKAVTQLREVFPDSTGRDRLLYLMELGNLLRLSGSYTEARLILLEADRMSDMQRGVELGQEAEAFLTSDLALEFRGADYEKVMINYGLALAYALDGNMEDALVECRRVNDKLRAMNLAYGDHPNRYSDDAFVRYLMGVLFEMSGDLNNALIAYRNSSALYDSVYAGEYGLSVPDRVEADILRLSSELGMQTVFQEYGGDQAGTGWMEQGPDSLHGEVVLILETGMIPPRSETEYTFVADGKIYRVSLPGIREIRRERLDVTLSTDDVTSRGFLAEDLAAIARENLEDHAGRDIARAVARLALKAGVAEAGEQLVEELTQDDSAVSQVAGLVLSIFGAATENADLRAWLTLPAQIYVARLRLPAGEQVVTIRADGRLLGPPRTILVQPWEISLLFESEPGP
jgi:uncharacterized protein